MMRGLGVIAGAAGGMLVGKKLSEMEKPIDAKIIAGGSLVLGFLLPNFAKGPLFEGIGLGLMASGGVSLLQDFGVLNGVPPLISGYRDVKVISGLPDVVKNYAPTAAKQMQPLRTTEVLFGSGVLH